MSTSNGTEIRIPLWVIWLILPILAACVLLLWFLQSDTPRWQALLGGLIGGLTVFALEQLMRVKTFTELEGYRNMGVRHLLRNRHDKVYYGKILDRATRSVRVMGTSCSRFIGDFLDPNSDDRKLVERLRSQTELVVYLLIPNEECMDDQRRSAFASVSGQVRQVQEEFEERFQIRRFNEKARHSFVIVDDELIAGPVFEDDQSRHAPAVHVSGTTEFGRKYISYFDALWKKSENGRVTNGND